MQGGRSAREPGIVSLLAGLPLRDGRGEKMVCKAGDHRTQMASQNTTVASAVSKESRP